jgi:phosphatidylethanolamine/phosphatidyl-N-methylethanolamine N-methyltransferase
MRINTNRWNRIRYTLAAPVYDAVARFNGARSRSVAGLRLQAGERILISGAGTGSDLDFIPAGVAVSAIDITPAMVARFERRAARLGRRVDVRVGDAARLPFASDSFDAVVLHLILAVAPDPVAVLREAERVLRPGGRIAVFDKWSPDGRPPSLLRRTVNLVTSVAATDITRRFGELVEGTDLRVEAREPADFGGLFEIALLRKT